MRRRSPPAGGPEGAGLPAVEGLARDASSRKRFLGMVGGAGAAGMLAALLAGCGAEYEPLPHLVHKPPPKPKQGEFGEGDGGVVNYLLTLELIEDDFYKQVIERDAVTDRELVRLLEEIAEHEKEHVETLSKVVEQLGETPVEKPKTTFERAIEGGPGEILSTAATIESLGAAAYLEQLKKIEDDEVLAMALAIHTVEAGHAAALDHVAGTTRPGGGELGGSAPGGRDLGRGPPGEGEPGAAAPNGGEPGGSAPDGGERGGSLTDGAFARPMSVKAVLEQIKQFHAG